MRSDIHIDFNILKRLYAYSMRKITTNKPQNLKSLCNLEMLLSLGCGKEHFFLHLPLLLTDLSPCLSPSSSPFFSLHPSVFKKKLLMHFSGTTAKTGENNYTMN